MTTVAIHQPNFFPWIGYFEKIQNCDWFVFLDDVQFSKGSYTNRMFLRNINDEKVLPITCPVSYKHPSKIKDVNITHTRWVGKATRTVVHNYPDSVGSIHANGISSLFYSSDNNLSRYNIRNIMQLCRIIGIKPRKGFLIQSEIGDFTRAKTELIIDICGYLGADTYYSGTGAKSYIDETALKESGVETVYQDNSTFHGYSIIHSLLTIGITGILENGWLR